MKETDSSIEKKRDRKSARINTNEEQSEGG